MQQDTLLHTSVIRLSRQSIVKILLTFDLSSSKRHRVKKVKHLLPANIQADEDDAEEDC